MMGGSRPRKRVLRRRGAPWEGLPPSPSRKRLRASRVGGLFHPAEGIQDARGATPGGDDDDIDAEPHATGIEEPALSFNNSNSGVQLRSCGLSAFFLLLLLLLLSLSLSRISRLHLFTVTIILTIHSSHLSLSRSPRARMAPTTEGGHPREQVVSGETRGAGAGETANGHVEARRHWVTVIGSGNWGSVAAKIIASNATKLDSFHDEVKMWVYEEMLPTGEKLTNAINQTNENVKYLPGIKLGPNVVADPDLENAVKEANMLVFVTPHQFVEGICRRLVGKIRHDAEAISLVKGMEVKMDGPCMISKLISEMLGINCCVLMGANIANEIAVEKFSEATVGYRGDKAVAQRWVRLFSTPYFLVSPVQDVEGVELCGTLKNVVAIAAGLVDGLDMGNNTKAAIMRIGLREMRAFSKLMFSSVRDSTFFESCGVADLITTCLGGRNRKVAEAFARCGGKRSFDELEAELLQGQKLQGVSTAREVYEVLGHRGWQELFPLFTTVHEICISHLPPSAIVEYSEHTPNFSLVEGSDQLY